ncbi:MAG: CapA family protein, partial [Lachnospiraceae bacterium]|nr:CapA family protein [Lachnospiraceae bacterium]
TNWGANLIIGTHPHVVQNSQWIKLKNGKKAFCIYSLGNFANGQVKPDNLIGAVYRCHFKVRFYPNGKKSVSILEPKLHPYVTVYGSGHSDIHVEWLKDYTPKEALSHGVRSSNSSFNYNFICDVLKKNISSRYLVMPKRRRKK